MSQLEPSDSEQWFIDMVRNVARKEGKQPLDLPPLGRTIDVDAVNALFDRSHSGSGTIEFTYCGYDVTVHADGRADVAEGD